MLVPLDLERRSHLGHLSLTEPGERRCEQFGDLGTESRRDLRRPGE